MVDLMVPRRVRRTGLAAFALGLGIAAAAQLATPPLYDGVVVVQPYVYVNPPAGKPGGAKGASAHLALSGSRSPLVALATPEQPPQAQVVAGDGTLVLPATATALDVSITPFDPSVDAAAASTARVLGNVYRFAVVDHSGEAATAPAAALVTVVLRAPEDAPDATLGQLVDGAWHPLKSEPMFGSTYVAVVTSFGDFAVVVPGASTPSSAASSSSQASSPAAEPAATTPGAGGGSGSGSLPPANVIGAVVVLALLAFIGVAALLRARRGLDDRRRGGGW
jgi:hypothetical protein